MLQKGLILLLLACAAGLSRADETPPAVTDGEVWNEGVGYYRAGDVTNALRVLRPLMLTREFGPRAAEVVAKIAYDAAHAPGAAAPAKSLEEAAAAAQIALRANPGDARANRNFTRATDGLPALRETAHINAVLKAAEGKDQSAALQRATEDVRRLFAESATYRDRPAAEAVAKADAYAARAEKLADVWIPVREQIAQSVTNEQEAAAVTEVADQARARMLKAARELGDLDGEAYATLAASETEYTRFLKMVIQPPAAIREDLAAQSNAWQDVEAFNNRPWQGEALDYTRAFRQKFPAWAQAYEQQAQADTNKPPFTAEAQAKVSALSTELEKIQIECAKAPDPTLQEKALDIIREIMELLPKDGGGGGQQNQQQKDQDKNSPNNDDRKSDDKQDPGQQPETPEDQDLGQQDENPQQEKPEDQKDEEKPGADESEEDKDVEALLKKALERSAEHEAEKKARMYRAPRNDSDRDW